MQEAPRLRAQRMGPRARPSRALRARRRSARQLPRKRPRASSSRQPRQGSICGSSGLQARQSTTALTKAITQLVSNLPDGSPSAQYGGLRRLTNRLNSAVNQEGDLRPVPTDNLPAIDHLGSLIAATAAFDAKHAPACAVSFWVCWTPRRSPKEAATRRHQAATGTAEAAVEAARLVAVPGVLTRAVAAGDATVHLRGRRNVRPSASGGRSRATTTAAPDVANAPLPHGATVAPFRRAPTVRTRTGHLSASTAAFRVAASARSPPKAAVTTPEDANARFDAPAPNPGSPTALAITLPVSPLVRAQMSGPDARSDCVLTRPR
jgi:hypothetical protein